MTDLFDQRVEHYRHTSAPLAERMRPRSFEELVGHAELVGPTSSLRTMLAGGRLRSMILWGPPGSGKTTLARIVAEQADAQFIQLSATGAGVKDVREAIGAARDALKFGGKRTVVFIDEIHRFNKGQQDALLHAVEDGVITLLGATTENPSFEITGALLSRCQLMVLSALLPEHLSALLDRALSDSERGLGEWKLALDAAARKALVQYAQGDARALLGALEISALKAHDAGMAVIDAATVQTALGARALLYDKQGEEHYNLASALIKSMRGSDPDAACYYTVRMLEGGETPRFVARRMAIFASEDVGNADPLALNLAASALHVVENIGMPEALYTLTQLAAYLALAPKSDATKRALAHARSLVSEHGPLPVPMRIRNAPTATMKELGYGKDYVSPHQEQDGIAGECHLPDAIVHERLYFPVDRGYETILRKRLEAIFQRRAGGAGGSG